MVFPFGGVALAAIPWAKIGAAVSSASLMAGPAARLAEQSRKLYESIFKRGSSKPTDRQNIASALTELEAKAEQLAENDLKQAELLFQHEEIISSQAEAIDQLTQQNEGLAEAVQILSARSKLLSGALALVFVLAVAALLAALFL